LILFHMLDEVTLRWPGIDTKKVFMMGFSGGGQFAHRFMYLHPERLLGVSIGAPGRVTMLDEREKWPRGVQDIKEVFGTQERIQKEMIRLLPIQLVVGSADNVVHGGDAFWEWLNRKKFELEKGQNASECLHSPPTGRLDIMKELHEVWKKDGIASTLDIVDGVKHDVEGVLETVKDFLRVHIKSLQH
jgi:poly(3-hydroxybutyrate) depolymerase